MVKIIEIKGVGRVKNMLTGYARTIPKMADKGVYNLARFGAKALKEEAKNAGIKHWGGGKKQLFSKATRAKKVRKGVYNVVMPPHGAKLDKGNYFISLYRGRLVTKWAKERFGTKRTTGRSRVRFGLRGGVQGGFLYVTPKPFIRKAVKRTREKTIKIVTKEINKAIRRRGRR